MCEHCGHSWYRRSQPITTLHNSSIFYKVYLSLGVLLVYTVGTVFGFFSCHSIKMVCLAVSEILYCVNRLEQMPKFYPLVVQNAWCLYTHIVKLERKVSYRNFPEKYKWINGFLGDFRLPPRSIWELRSSAYYVSSGNFLPTFRNNLSVAFSRVKNPKENLFFQYRIYTEKSVGGEKSQ